MPKGNYCMGQNSQCCSGVCEVPDGGFIIFSTCK
jgi:hypothetical protein